MDSDKQTVMVYTNSFVGIACNFLLLYLVLADTSKHNVGYKNMLSIVTAYNIYYASLHPILDMGFLIDEYGFVMFSKHFADFGYWTSYLAIMVYMDAFNKSLTLLAIHCLYRYVKVSGKWRFLFDSKKWIFVLFMFNFVFGPAWCVICHICYHSTPERTEMSKMEAMKRFNVNLEEIGYIGPVMKWPNPQTGAMQIRWFNVLGSFGCSSILLILYAIICLGCVRLYRFISTSMVSERTKKLNYQLLRLLLIQTIAPLIFEYIPCIMAIWGGFIGMPFALEFGWWIPICTSAYSIADSLMVIIGFKAYRERLFAILRLFRFSNKILSSSEASDHRTTKGGPSEIYSSNT
ncbi:unnamed protein product, partial [Mesorhabditis belari]|uniref:Uncharacterized protein n=1 Tax=Mesorhabditis belari TaxID=2138241 RepID=A0AAF3J4S6_9BILA